MSTMPQTDSDFQSAAAPPERVGFRGEVSDWVEQDPDLAEAAESLCVNWGFMDRLPIRHECMHVVLSLPFYTHPKLMEGKSYQGDHESECYREQIQNYVGSSVMEKEDFVLYVQIKAISGAVRENTSRVLAWLVAPLVGKTVQDLKKIDNYGTLPGEAMNKGIEVEYTHDHGSGKTVKVTITSPEHGVFVASESGIEFPERFSKRNEITPFVVPSDEEAGAIFDVLQPGLDFLRAELAKDGSALSRIKVSQIVGLIQKGPSSGLDQKVVRGMDAYPA